MDRIRLNISQLNELKSLFLEKRGVDYKHFSLMLFKYILEDFCVTNKVSSFNGLSQIIDSDSQLANELILEIGPRFTELFRGPSSWLAIKNTVIPNVLSRKEKLDILLLGARSAHELVSLNILLDQMNVREKVNIKMVDIDKSLFERFKSELTSEKDIKAIENNIEQLGFNKGVKDYLNLRGDKYVYKDEMLNNCTFIESSIGKGKEVGNFDLVIARDILMCYDKMHHEKVLRWMLYHIALGQFIVFGVKDSIAWTTSRNTIKVVDEEARLFKKVRV